MMQNGMAGRSATEGCPAPTIQHEIRSDGLHQPARPFHLRAIASSPTYCTPPAVPMFQPAVASHGSARSVDFGRRSQPRIKQEVAVDTHPSPFSTAPPPSMSTGNSTAVTFGFTTDLRGSGASLKRPLPSLEIYQPPKRKCVPTGAACMHCSSPHHSWTECYGLCLVCSGQHSRRRCSRIPLELYLGPARGFTVLERYDVEHAEPSPAMPAPAPAPAASSRAGNGMPTTAPPRAASVARGVPAAPSSAGAVQKSMPAALAPHIQRISLGTTALGPVPDGAARNRVLDLRPSASSKIEPAAMEGLNPQRVAMIAAAPKVESNPKLAPAPKKGPERTAANMAPLGKRPKASARSSASAVRTATNPFERLPTSEQTANEMMTLATAVTDGINPQRANMIATTKEASSPPPAPPIISFGTQANNAPVGNIPRDQETWSKLCQVIYDSVRNSRDKTKNMNNGTDRKMVEGKIKEALRVLKPMILRESKLEFARQS